MYQYWSSFSYCINQESFIHITIKAAFVSAIMSSFSIPNSMTQQKEWWSLTEITFVSVIDLKTGPLLHFFHAIVQADAVLIRCYHYSLFFFGKNSVKNCVTTVLTSRLSRTHPRSEVLCDKPLHGGYRKRN